MMNAQEAFKKLKLLITTDDPKEFYRTLVNPSFDPINAVQTIIKTICTRSGGALTDKLIHHYILDEPLDDNTITMIEGILKPLAHYYEFADPDTHNKIEHIIEELKTSKDISILTQLKSIIAEQGTVIRRLPDLMKTFFMSLHGIKSFYRIYDSTKDLLPPEQKAKLDDIMNQIYSSMKERQKELKELFPELEHAEKPEDLCNMQLPDEDTLTQKGIEFWRKIRDTNNLFYQAWNIMITYLADPQELVEFIFWLDKPEAQKMMSTILEQKTNENTNVVDHWKELLNKKDYLQLATDLDIYLSARGLNTKHIFNYEPSMTSKELVESMIAIIDWAINSNNIEDPNLIELKKLLESEKAVLATIASVIHLYSQ